MTEAAGRRPRGADSGAFLKAAMAFFNAVLKVLAKHPPLAFAWGVSVLLFLTFLALLFFGPNPPQNALYWLGALTLISISTLAGVTLWLTREVMAAPDTPAPARLSAVRNEARRNAELLSTIAGANERILQRGREGGEPWSRLMQDTYNRVCQECQARRRGGLAPDAYFDALAWDADVRTVCDEKWRLGEAVDDYRKRIEELGQPSLEHEALELEIRRAVTQPDCTPAELQAALNGAIAKAQKVAR